MPISVILTKKRDLRETLHFIARLLKDVAQPWAFTGSVGMALQGVNLEIADIDIQTNQTGSYQIQDHLSKYTVSKVRYLESLNIRSHFGTFRINEIAVEVMGDIEKRLDDGSWIGPPNLYPIIRLIDLDGVNVPALDLEYEKEAYRILGRVDTVREVEEFLFRRRTSGGKSA
jgi:hypothetical protein